LGDFVSPLALSAAPPAGPLGESVADFAPALGESVVLCDLPSFDVALDAGFLPDLVGVVGDFAGVLPAAGDGAMLLEVRAVCGDGVLEDDGEVLSSGE